MKTISERAKALRLEHDEREEEERPPRPRRRLALALIAAGVAGALLWWAFSNRPPVVRTVAARAVESAAGRGPSTLLEGSGLVIARRQATVSASLTGRLTEILHREGMRVEEGQLLARLDDSKLKAMLELDQARLAAARQALSETEVLLAEAELELDRTRRLFDERIASQSALDAAELAVRSLKARLEQGHHQLEVASKQVEVRRQEIEDTRVRAPFAGVVISQNAQLGETVSPVTAGGGFTRTGICTIADMDSLEAEVEISERYISRVRPGLNARVVLDAHPELAIGASVVDIVPAADALTATFKVHLAFESLDPRILPNMRVKVAFLDRPTSDADASAGFRPVPTGVLVPSGALEETAQGWAVYVVRDDVLARREVTPGERRGADILVLEGLTAGDRVVFPVPSGAAEGLTVVEKRDAAAPPIEDESGSETDPPG